jgi:polysaccharide deacetylase 2 family uncharacterized protein YibQ
MKKFLSSTIAVVLVLAVAGLFFFKFIYMPKVRQAEKEGREQVEKFLVKEILVDPALIIAGRGTHQLDMTVRMPQRYDPSSLKKAFEVFDSAQKDMTLTFNQAAADKSESLVITIESPFSQVGKIRFIKSLRPKIAVILDDWGYRADGLGYLKSIKQVFTISVLPGLKYSTKAAEEAHSGTKGVMLHLPMEPTRKMPMEKDTILADMSRGEVIRILDKDMNEVPYMTGVNNHEGSLATEKKEVMHAVMEILKQKGLFFIDSLTSPKTVAYKTAVELGVPAGKRNIFIDNKKKSDYNEEQINKLKALAKAKGWAIGIGHDDPVTLETLSRMMPQLEAEGFEFVYVAELLQ